MPSSSFLCHFLYTYYRMCLNSMWPEGLSQTVKCISIPVSDHWIIVRFELFLPNFSGHISSFQAKVQQGRTNKLKALFYPSWQSGQNSCLFQDVHCRYVVKIHCNAKWCTENDMIIQWLASALHLARHIFSVFITVWASFLISIELLSMLL